MAKQAEAGKIGCMQANYVQRLRLTFRKDGPTRFIGHLDLARTLERTLNRARIPVAYTQGFNRRPRMQIAAALPLGFTSDCEMADIYLTEAVDPEVAKAKMAARAAPGIDIYRVEEIPIRDPALQTVTQTASYHVILLDPVDTAVLQQKIDSFFAAESVVRERGHGRKRKSYDIRPLVQSVQLEADKDPVCLRMRLLLQHSKSGRPDELLRTLDIDPLATRIHRTEITFDY